MVVRLRVIGSCIFLDCCCSILLSFGTKHNLYRDLGIDISMELNEIVFGEPSPWKRVFGVVLKVSRDVKKCKFDKKSAFSWFPGIILTRFPVCFWRSRWVVRVLGGFGSFLDTFGLDCVLVKIGEKVWKSDEKVVQNWGSFLTVFQVFVIN